MLRLIRAMDPKRYTPVVLLFSDGPLVQAFKDIGVEIHVLPADTALVKTDRNTLGGGSQKSNLLTKLRSAFKAALFVPRLAHRIRRLNVDLIHTNTLKADVLGSLANLFIGKPLVWYVHDRIAPDYLPMRVARLMRFLARHMPDYLLANSYSSMDNVATHRIHRCAVVYPGVDAAAFIQAPQRSPSDRPLIGLVGRVSSTKGQDVFIRAAARVLLAIPKARFRIIGAALFNEAPYELQLRDLAQSLSLGNSLQFAGFCADITSAIAQLDLLVHASTVPEPFGQVVVEGMAAGKPVVATNAGGIPEVVIENVSGILVAPGDIDAMANAIIQILKDPAAARAMGQAGRTRALELFTIEITAREVQKAYDIVLQTVVNR